MGCSRGSVVCSMAKASADCAPIAQRASLVRDGALSFKKSDRLRVRPEFLRVQQRGKRVHGRHFIYIVLRIGLVDEGCDGSRRLGVTVTKRIAGAVGRNRVKRLVRSVFRQERTLFPLDCEVVVVAKRGAHELSYAQVREDLARVQYGLRRVASSQKSLQGDGERR